MSLSFLHSPFFVSFFGSSRILGDAKSYVGDRCRIKVKKVSVVLVPICIPFGTLDLVVVPFQSACVNRAFGVVCQTVDSLFLQLGESCSNGCPLSSALRQS